MSDSGLFLTLFLGGLYVAGVVAFAQVVMSVYSGQNLDEQIRSEWKARAMLAGVLVLLVLGWPFLLVAELLDGEDP